MGANLQLAWMLAEHLLLIALPAALAVALAMRQGLRSVPLLLALALAASGAGAMLVFWAYFADPLVGEATAFLLALGSIQGIVLCRRALDREVLRQLVAPLALWALAAAFVLYLGFLHGGTEQPLAMATTRFSHPLPTDNEIPLFFSDWFYAHGHVGPSPPFVDWLSSDRPPLQIGYVLSQRPFAWDDSGLHYQVLGVVLQQLWVVGMWALLCAARLPARVRGLLMLAALVSDVAILHGFFVWPKLLPAAFLLAALALVISPEWPRLRAHAWSAVLLATLCGLALLGHGSSAFVVVALSAAVAWRGVPSWRWLGTAALVGVVLLAPWSAYQRYYDPPGDRLVKWQLGGSVLLDDRGAAEAIVDGYREAGLGGALENKWGNLTQMVGQKEEEGAIRGAVDEVEAGHPGLALAALRQPRFFALLPFLGILLIGPIAFLLARAWRTREGPVRDFALAALAFCAGGCAIWALMMFGGPNAKTLIHQGSLAIPLLAVCGCVAAAYAVSRRLAIALVAANATLVLAMYVPALTPPPGSAYSPLAAVLATAGLAGFGLVALRPDPAEPEPG